MINQIQQCLARLSREAVSVILIVLLVSGCASSAPGAKFEQALASDHVVGQSDLVNVEVTASEGLEMLDEEAARVSKLIKDKTDIEKTTGTTIGRSRNFQVEVLVTRYEKGNRLARAVLSGLVGQIHIDAMVSVYLLPGREKVSEFEIKKTFAWGSAYGAVTSIDDVEEGFAKGVAEALTRVAK